MFRKPNFNRVWFMVAVLVIFLLGNVAWVLADNYRGAEDSQTAFSELEAQTSRGDQYLYTPAVQTYGHFSCTVVNVSNQTVNTSVEIRMLSGWSIGPIGGPLPPGGVWIATATTTGDWARGIVTIAGDKGTVRAACISTDSSRSSNGVAVHAE